MEVGKGGGVEAELGNVGDDEVENELSNRSRQKWRLTISSPALLSYFHEMAPCTWKFNHWSEVSSFSLLITFPLVLTFMVLVLIYQFCKFT